MSRAVVATMAVVAASMAAANMAACTSTDLWAGRSGSGAPPASAVQATFVRAVGERGSSAGQFVRPAGISTNSLGHVFVVDAGNDRGQHLSPTGRYVDEIGGFGWGELQFNHPLLPNRTAGASSRSQHESL